jgi:hypothetical protein
MKASVTGSESNQEIASKKKNAPKKRVHPKIMAAWMAARDVQSEVEAWITNHDNAPGRLYLKPQDQFRLLILKAWTFKFKITMEELLDILIPVLRKVTKEKQARYKPGGLMVQVSALTGNYARSIVTSTLGQKYPNQEHLLLWRERQRKMQLEREEEEELEGLAARDKDPFALLDEGDVQSFISGYIKKSVKRRQQMQDALEEEWRRRKHYPSGNPWL